MKAERINQDQIRFTLSEIDLQQRNLKVSELAYGSEKTKALFADMMKTALDQFGMDFSQKPLMIEAIPLEDSGLTITVTRVSGMAELGALFGSNLPEEQDTAARQERTPEEAGQEQGAFAGLLAAGCAIYIFKDFEQLCQVARRIPGNLTIRNALYRNLKTGEYYLIVHYKKMDHAERFITAVLSQYCESWVLGEHAKMLVVEHAKPVVKARAIQKLAGVEQDGGFEYAKV